MPQYRPPLFTCDLFDRAREPLPRAQCPEAHAVRENDPDCDDGVVECLRVDWIRLWQDERNRNERDPHAGYDCDGI